MTTTNPIVTKADIPPAEDLVALTMTPDAGREFLRALMYAAARIPRAAVVQADDEMDHADWLQWAANRLDAAIRTAALGEDERAELEAMTNADKAADPTWEI